MATYPGYYVGTTLDTIGNNMAKDRAIQSQTEIARMEQQRLQAQAVAKYIQDMAMREQQQRQFMDELAFRKQAQDQQNAYQQALLRLKDKEWGQMSPAQTADDRYRYEALANALKIAETNTKARDPRVEAAKIIQDETSKREQAFAAEEAEAFNEASKAKAARWNQRFKLLDDQLEQERVEKAGEWTTTERGANAWLRAEKPKRYAALINELQQLDKSVGDVIPDSTGTRFQPVARRVPGAQIPGTQVPGQPTSQSPVGNLPIRVQNSRGQIFDIPASQWAAAKQRDPGVRMINQGMPGTPSRAVAMGANPVAQALAQPQAAQQPAPSRRGLLQALYGNARDFYGDAYNTAIDTYSQPLVAPVGTGLDYYQQLIDMLNSGQAAP